MTAVEWLEEELKANLKKVILEGDSELMESLFEQAKEMEKEHIYSEQEVRKAIELARETELKTGGYDPRPFTSDKYSKQEIINQLKLE